MSLVKAMTISIYNYDNSGRRVTRYGSGTEIETDPLGCDILYIVIGFVYF